MSPARAQADRPGSIRGVVTDKDFDTPVAQASVSIVELSLKTETGDQGNYVLRDVPPGSYTVVFAREGYLRQVRADVVVRSGELTDLDASLSGEFTEMDELVVQDLLQLGAGSEASLLKLRFDSPALMDSIGADLMGRAGAGDAASALRLVSGATVQNGKSAVIRGLPDRYVSSQMNGFRLPTADENKRAVDLDQFPASVIESVQVSKTFTPDQQGDASGGAVNLKLKGIPDEPFFQIKEQLNFNSQVAFRRDFLTYDGGGVGAFGFDDGARDPQANGQTWKGAVGVSRADAPLASKWSAAAGGKLQLSDDVKIGGILSLFYTRDASFYDDGVNDSKWVVHPGDPMTPQYFQGTPQQGSFKTALFDVTRGMQMVQWGGLASIGIESKHDDATLSYLYTHTAQDTATLSVDTRGKPYYFPGFDPNDPMGPGNEPANVAAAPYLRLETLDYVERTTDTLQLHGVHRFEVEPFGSESFMRFHDPELAWGFADSGADFNEPDKRQFGALWEAASYNPGFPPYIPPFTVPATWYPYPAAENINFGNIQHVFKRIHEHSDDYSLDFKLPFTQWSETEGFVKAGVFDDDLSRTFVQDTFTNSNDFSSFIGGFDDAWSREFPFENHPITASTADDNYDGKMQIRAVYSMLDLPLSKTWSAIGGARFESTHIGVVNFPEPDAVWFPPGSDTAVKLNPGDADVDFNQDRLLPAIGLQFTPVKEVTLRGSYAETVARQTFKELTPVVQQEYLGGPVFIGNPDLQMSRIKNYDLRVDCVPYDGSLISTSWFDKDVIDPIEYVQRVGDLNYTTPVNYPKGTLTGIEVEIRQDLGHWTHRCDGLSFGANATFINSQVTLPDDEAAGFDNPGIMAPMHTRDMTNAPDHLYNLYSTYDIPDWGTQLGLFYTVTGDTLVAGAGQSTGNFVPSVYALEYGTLNASVSQPLGPHFVLQFQAKNLLNPQIAEVYRSPYIGDDVLKTSYTKGIEYSISLSAKFSL